MGSFRVLSVAGIPVHFTLWYLLILLFWLQGGLERGLIWGGVITVSILVHELGHGMVARHYRLSPWIEIHGWGGLCHHERAPSAGADAKILIAGPGAGLVLGALSWGLLKLVGGALVGSPRAAMIVHSLVYVNLIWSLINLVPLWPLDGGQLFRLGLMRVLKPARAEQITHLVGTGIGLFAVFLAHNLFSSVFLTVIAGLITWQNIMQLTSSSASGPVYTVDRTLKPLLAEAEQALAEKRWADAARLGAQLKADHDLSPAQLQQVFEVLGVSAVGLGQHSEAWSYLKRTPSPGGRTYFAWVECILRLEQAAGMAPAAIANENFARLPESAQAALRRLLPEDDDGPPPL